MISHNPAYTKYLMDKCGVAWFKMDEESGNLVDSKDSFIGTNNGSNVVTGLSGNARSFNGTNSHVIFNAPVVPVGKKSIRFKFKYSDIPSTDIAIIDCGGTSAQRGFLFATNPSGIVFQVSRGTSGTFNFRWAGGHYNDNSFHDFLYTYDGTLSSNSVKIYIDNVLVHSGTALSLESGVYSNNLTLGRFASVASGFGKGVLDELEIYNEVIDPVLKKILISSGETTYSLYKKVGKPLVPLMDGYDNAFGSVIGSASYSTGYTWKAFDNDDTTAYGTNFIPDSSKPIYVGFRFNEPVCVKRYSFLAGLRTFKFMASNNGTTWDTLDTKTSLVSNTSTIQTFDIQNDKFYSYYKLEATLATSGNAWVSIFSVQFYGLMPSILLECPSSEGSYIRNGMDKGFQMDTVEELNIMQQIKEDSIPLGSGKLFRQPIDRSKHKANKIILG
ncbi:hypothetical protein HF638_02655 [Paenibacillus sp. SZ31]|uniref:LamG-like jellyroll fold domain-containing protein n=1 Tax=Paenibacillus sp. SZ31 TaxID=2725555 RepID=UPI00146B5AD9|nr:LamG-like jellyroll fold domain-containing protein [Paenibacillus sp. SZ31]NMI02856.1 hypothetical protein [Paenibacillus sp. SZ31]